MASELHSSHATDRIQRETRDAQWRNVHESRGPKDNDCESLRVWQCAEEVMTRNPLSIGELATLREAALFLTSKDISAGRSSTKLVDRWASLASRTLSVAFT